MSNKFDRELINLFYSFRHTHTILVEYIIIFIYAWIAFPYYKRGVGDALSTASFGHCPPTITWVSLPHTLVPRGHTSPTNAFAPAGTFVSAGVVVVIDSVIRVLAQINQWRGSISAMHHA